ncbi:hypothetical protein BIV24_07145 [Streptomyces colonosanans]|uniref:Large membrane protein n=1 Tax=Streptomyces colonosanans TaxID=1428652 RepID=A0A1S2PUD9_9ACTN|nr:hypothetical protein BIV24_07145 [Streptomyces colonosanans]
MVVASVAAAVLLAGGGGAYLAAAASGGSGGSAPGGDGAPPALTLDGYGEGGSPPGIAVGEPDPYGTTYRARGTLPDGPSSAPVYWAKGEVTQDEAARLARALDVAGTPKRDGRAWTVGAAKDGSGPALRVTVQTPGTWTFSRSAPGSPPSCEDGKPCTSAEDSPRPVSESAARKAAAPVLKALGQDDAALDAHQALGSVRVVNADPKVGGLPTFGWSTGLQVAADGRVTGGSGTLKAPLKGAVYPVLGARKTLDLMNGAPTSYGRKGIGGCASPVPLKDRDETPCGASTAVPKRASAVVEGAVFGLAVHAVNGTAVLVPSWLFEVRPAGTRDAFTVTRPAVDPRYLTAPQPPGQPSEEPGPRTGGPDATPSSVPTRRDVRVMGYTTDGKDLTIAYQGGVCADYAASVSESAGRVTVAVTETPWQGKVCIMIAKVYHRTLHLKAPLGDRAVVGSDGRRIPRGTAGMPPEAASGHLGALQPQ